MPGVAISGAVAGGLNACCLTTHYRKAVQTMARLGAGTRKRADGTLEKRFTIDGKRYSVYGKTAKEISQKEQEIRKQIEAGMYTDNSFPWIYDMGKELIDILKSANSPDEKSIAIREFREMVDFTFSRHPMMRDIFGRTKDSMMFMKELPYSLMRYLDEISEQCN